MGSLLLGIQILSVSAATNYVSTAGIDAPGNGTFGAPYATVQYAADQMGAGDTCIIRGGRYQEEISISNTDNLTFAAYDGETVVLDGSTEITNSWTLYSGNIYKTTLTEDVWQLFADGEMLIPARWPNADPNIDFWEQWESDHWAEGRSPRNSSPPVDVNGTMYDKPHSGIDLAASGLNISNAIAVLNLGSFRTWTRVVNSHVPGSNTFTHDLVSSGGYKDKEHYYFVEGKLELLDAENEWFFDTVTKELYVWVPGGGSPAGLEIKGKNTTYCLTATNCDDLTVSGIDFFAGTFNLDGCLRARVENGELTYPSYTRRMLRIIETPQTTKVNSDFATVYNCTFAYTDGHGINVGGDDSTIENCYFHHIDYSCSELPSVMPALYIGGSRVTFRQNTLHSFGASVGLLQGNAGTTEYNNFYNGGYKQHDGAMVQVMVAKQTNANIGWNWVHDWSRLGIRFDGAGGGAGGVGGLVHHSVGWGPNMNSTVFIGNHENNEIISNSGIYSKSRPEIVVESGGNSNTNTITRNNFARQIAGTTTDGSAVPGIVDHNWDGYDLGLDIRTQVRDPDNLDFRPLPGADIVDAGTNYPGVTDGYVGSAPDIGAYEYGAANYWIAGHQAVAASIPVPPEGTTDAKGSASLIWQPALGTLSNDVYLGTSSNVVASATPVSPEYKGNVVNNIYDPLGLYAQTYYWRIDSITATGTVKGEVWSFAASGVSANPPGIVNIPADYVSEDFAVIGGQITDGGTAAQVWMHWWKDGGTTNTVDMGVQDYSFELSISGLSTNTLHHFQCQASNTYGVSWASPVESFTTDGAVWVGGTFTNWVELAYDDFDPGWGDFVSDGNAALAAGSPPAVSGNAAHFNSSDEIELAAAINLDAPGYTQLKLEFNLYFQGMDNLDFHFVELWDGAVWQEIASFNKTPYGNGNHHSVEILIDEGAYTFSTNFNLRFRHSSGLNDNAYVDEVRLSALEIVTFNTAYDEWVYENGLSGIYTNHLADADGDGVLNLVEYGLGGEPTVDDAATLLPISSVVDDGGTSWMEYVYTRRTDAEYIGLGYWVEWATNMVGGVWSTNGVLEVGSMPLETGFEEVTNRVEALEANPFIRLRISVE